MNAETYDLQTQIEIIREARRQGFDDGTIAERLGLKVDDPILTIDLEAHPLGMELSGIGEGFREWEFFGLDDDVIRKILIIMARLCESSYRRGLHQGWCARDTNQKFRIKPDELRWGSEPLDSARMPLCGTEMSSLKRLQCQHGFDLQALGFCIDEEH